MCSSCKMDPRDVKIMRQRQGAVEVDDFYEEVNYKPKAKKSKAVKKKNYPGCPGNEGKAHIYIWTTEGQRNDFFFDFYGFHKYESRLCAGCMKKNGSRLTERYEKRKSREWDKRYGGEFNVKRGKPVSRWGRGPSYSWWSFENDDEEYRKKRSEYLQRKGWTEYLYGHGLW